jgi:DNA replication protein DnaC
VFESSAQQVVCRLGPEEQVKSPFRGLDFFDFDDAHLFYGRARAIATCTERLEQLAAKGKAFLLIYGMSGSGKSSLLRAGLWSLVSLRRQREFAFTSILSPTLKSPMKLHLIVSTFAVTSSSICQDE